MPLRQNKKAPYASAGGWPVDPDEEFVYTAAEVAEHEWQEWAIIGNKKQNLLVIDVDFYEMEEHQIDYLKNDADWRGLLDVTTLAETQGGGWHIYLEYDGKRPDSIHGVDIKGDVGKGYVKVPWRNGYSLINETNPVKADEQLINELPVTEVIHEEIEVTDYAWEHPPCVKLAKRIAKGDEDGNERLARDYLGYWKKAVSPIENVNSGEKPSVYEILESSKFPENTNNPAPQWLHTSPSSTGVNFRVDDNGETFRCWRHSATGNVFHLIGVKEGIIDCGDWHHRLGSDVWSKIYDVAEEKHGLTTDNERLTCEEVEDAGLCPYDCGRNFPTEL